MRYTKRIAQYLAAALVSVMICIAHSYADIRCLKISRQKGKITSRVIESSRAKCPKGSGLLLDLNLLAGPPGIAGIKGIKGINGANGSNGDDAKEAVWGDGSAGDLIVNSSTTLQTRNPQFRDIIINSGSTLSVASGSTLRATGTCKINVNGIINVLKGALPAAHSNTSTTYAARERLANHGLASSPPGSGELGEYIIGVGVANELAGGAGGVGMSAESARKLVRLTEVSYGSGGGAGLSVLGAGGGGFALYCKGAIIIQGTIVADGGSATVGGGGGAGGLVVIASKSSIVSSGTLSAKGGTGSSFLLDSSAGGGGGGGVIHLIAPHIIPGTIDVSGGSGGDAGFIASGLGVRAGSGGGAFGGSGGRGANVGDGFGQAVSGSSGHSLQTTVDDPATLLL